MRKHNLWVHNLGVPAHDDTLGQNRASTMSQSAASLLRAAHSSSPSDPERTASQASAWPVHSLRTVSCPFARSREMCSRCGRKEEWGKGALSSRHERSRRNRRNSAQAGAVAPELALSRVGKAKMSTLLAAVPIEVGVSNKRRLVFTGRAVSLGEEGQQLLVPLLD